MNKETYEEIMKICKHIKPRDEINDLPYMCGSKFNCIDVFKYAEGKYCGRMLKLINKGEIY